jgi:hypothetical protein
MLTGFFPMVKPMANKAVLLLMAVAAALSLTGCPGGDDGTGGSSPPSSGTVVYLADQDIVGVFELFLAGSGTKLNPALPVGRTVQSFALTPDATAVVYIADQDQNDVFELYRVNLASPGSSTKLNGPLVLCGSAVCGDVTAFAVTPDNSAVVYIADQRADDVFELFRTVLSSTANSKLIPDLAPGQNVDAFAVLPNSTGVTYRANQNTPGAKELYRVLFATAPITDRLITSPPLIAGQNVGKFTPTSDSANVVYIANRPVALNLFIVPATGGGDTQLNSASPPNPNSNVSDFAVTPDGLSVVFRADQDIDQVDELYRTIIAQAPTNTKLNPSLSFGKKVTSFGVIPDSSGVVYVADQTTVDVFELFRTVFSGGNSQLNPPFFGFEDVVDLVLLPNSTGVVYKADQNTDGVNEIYRAVFGFPGSTRLNPALSIGQNIATYTVSPDSASAIYRANQDNVAVIELYRAMFSSPGVSAKLNTPLAAGKNVTDFAVR